MKMRRVTSLTMLLAFAVMILTGIVLYVVPHGRVAYWADWRLLGLSKTQWGDLHITTGLLLVVSGILHVYYNWRPILTYLKNRSRQVRVFTREFNIALVLVSAFLVMTGLQLPPLSWVLEAGESIKDHAAEIYGEPPYGHAEESTLRILAKRLGLDLVRTLDRLGKAKVSVRGPEDRMLDIARRNGMTPQEVYTVIETGSAAVDAARAGLGRKPVAEISDRLGIDPQRAVALLARHGITVRGEGTLRSIAARCGRSPGEVYRLLDYGH